MAFRRNNRSPVRRGRTRFRRLSPLRTHVVKETRWNTSRFCITRELQIAGLASIVNMDFVLMSPRIMMELTLQPSTPVGGPVTNIGPLINQMESLRGVKIGGIVWDSHFALLNPVSGPAESFLMAYSKCTETLWTRRVDGNGIPAGPVAPAIQSTWRPFEIADSVFNPGENNEDLVRIHHTRSTLIPYANNAIAGDSDANSWANSTASTIGQPNWGGTRSIKLRKFITDDQTLNWNLVATRSDTVDEDLSITWSMFATVYWAMPSQR